MVMTANKTIKFDQLMKVFKNFVSKSETRPVLKLVYLNDNYFYATDSHQLLRVNKNYVSDIPESITDGSLIDPKTMNITEQLNYPDCSRLIPNQSNSTVLLNGNIKEFENVTKEIKGLKKGRKNKIVKMDITKNCINFSGQYVINEKQYKLEKEQKDDNVDLFKNYEYTVNSLNVEGDEIKIQVGDIYLNTALGTVKKLSKLSYSDVEMKINGNMRPILFTQNNVFDIIVMPIRTK